MAECIECLSPILGDHGIQTHGFKPWSSQANDLNGYSSLPSQALSITRREQELVVSESG